MQKEKRDEQKDRSTQRTNSRRLPVAQYNVLMCERKEMGCVVCNYERVCFNNQGAIDRCILMCRFLVHSHRYYQICLTRILFYFF